MSDLIGLINKVIDLLPSTNIYWFKPGDFVVYEEHVVKVKRINVDGSVVIFGTIHFYFDDQETIIRDVGNITELRESVSKFIKRLEGN